MKDYIEISVETTHLGSELVADLLSEFADGGISVSDVQDVIDLENSGKSWDYADEKIYSAKNQTENRRKTRKIFAVQKSN